MDKQEQKSGMYYIYKWVHGFKYYLQERNGDYVWNGLINNAKIYDYTWMNRTKDKFIGAKSERI
jgi:hypothetical protein